MMGNGAATIGITGATCCRIICQRFSGLPTSAVCHGRAKSRHLSLLSDLMARDYDFWVYIVTNRNHSVLYIAVTYRCNKLIYYEHYSDADEAFARETQLKKWSRAKKIASIDRLNPSWLD